MWKRKQPQVVPSTYAKILAETYRVRSFEIATPTSHCLWEEAAGMCFHVFPACFAKSECWSIPISEVFQTNQGKGCSPSSGSFAEKNVCHLNCLAHQCSWVFPNHAKWIESQWGAKHVHNIFPATHQCRIIAPCQLPIHWTVTLKNISWPGFQQTQNSKFLKTSKLKWLQWLWFINWLSVCVFVPS